MSAGSVTYHLPDESTTPDLGPAAPTTLAIVVMPSASHRRHARALADRRSRLADYGGRLCRAIDDWQNAVTRLRTRAE